jgi:hypothetical protein
MSAIRELISEFNNMCGESKTEMGDSAELELDKLHSSLNEANENLLSMVNQYCCRTVRPDGMPMTYAHDFMSTGEAAFEYLVNCGLAKWCENGVDIYDLKFPSDTRYINE